MKYRYCDNFLLNLINPHYRGKEMWKRTSILLAAFVLGIVFIATSFSGCLENGSETESELSKEVELDAEDAGGVFDIEKGQFVVITLEANPTTGYTWEVKEPVDELVLKQVGDIEFEPQSELVGAGGVQTIRFEVIGEGQVTIELVYHRPWETDVEPLETFSVQISSR